MNERGPAKMELFPMKTDPSSASGSRVSQAGRLLVGAALLAALAGCTSTSAIGPVSGVPDDYRVTHPIMIDERLQTVDIPVGIDAGLSTTMRGSVAGFAQRFRASRSPVMAIVVPDGSPNEVNAVRISHKIHDVLVGAGVSPSALDFRRYRAGPKESGAPIRLAYSKIGAHVEGCGAWTDRLDSSPGNRNYGNFGCATQSNLAAMVDNPLDLVYPREMTPADAGRRYTVLDGYRQGRIFASEQQVLGGQVSEAVPE
jgi:pilus assembly protein CpaD